MPIIPDLNHPAVIKQLIRQTRSLIKKKAIPFPETAESNYKIAAIFPIQQLKSYSKPEITTSLPEGYRALISDNNNIILALNFYNRGNRLHFSHAFDGAVLDEFISAINELAETYLTKKDKYRLCCIEFLHAGQPYLGIFTKSAIYLYTYQEGLLTKITKAQLRSKLIKIQSKVQPII